MKKPKILVTGADGFIGSHLVEHLVSLGYSVRAFTLYNSFNSWGWLDTIDPEIVEKLEVFAGDIRDPNCVRDAVQGCEVVLHLAALIAIPFSYQSPDSYVDVNIKGTLNVLQAARDLGCKKIIHTSTSEVYGTAKFVPITEEHPLQGQSPYSATKIGADQLALSFYRSFNLPVSIIRPFNTYGPRQSARAIIPTVITQIAAGKSELKLGNLSPTRDFTYVTDTVRGFAAAIHGVTDIGEVTNLGAGFEISIAETVNVIADVMGAKVAISVDEERLRPDKSEVDRLWSDNTKARERLGWEPELKGKEGFREGIKRTVAWFQNSENLKKYKEGVYNV